MMEVGSSLQNVSRARHTEMMLGPEASVGTPLGIPAGDNKGASMFSQGTGLFPSVSKMPVPLPSTIGGHTSTLSGSPVGDEAVPMSSSGQVTSIETLTMSPAATIDGNQTTYTMASPPDHGLSPPIPSAANWTTPIMPHNSLFEPSLPNVRSAEEFDKGARRDARNENIVIPPTAAPLDTDGMKVDVDDHRLNMATQPCYLGESQPSQADFNNVESRGETQLVHENQVELDDAQPPFAGETQPVNGHESFDDMVILHNNTLTVSAIPLTNADQSVSHGKGQSGCTASAIPLTNADQSVSHEPIHGKDARCLQDSYDVPSFTPRANISSNGIPASYPTSVSTGERETYATEEGPNGMVSITEATTVNKHPEVHPVETAGQLGLMDGEDEKDTNTPEPQLDLLYENVNGKGEEKMSKDGVAEIGVKDDVTGKAKGVSDQDIQAIKGRKVVKKFGRKNFEGDVVDYDAENQWFKVVYEDGDEEDLELLEVKDILFTADTSSNASTAKRKRSHPEGAVNDQRARKRKGTPKKKVSTAGAQKMSQQVKSPPGSKTKGLKRSAKSKSSSASAHENPVQSQPKSGAKRKRSSDVEAMTSSKLESENVGGKARSRENKQSGDAKTPRKSSAKRRGGKAMPKKNSARKKGRSHRSFSKLPIVESKVENVLGAGEGDKGEKPEGKRQKIDASKDQGTLVGKSVKKDFGLCTAE